MSDKPTLFTIDSSGLDTLRREILLNQRPLMRHLFGVAKYLGVGALIHAWLIGPTFERESLWSWGYLLAWPVPLLFWVIGTLAVFFLYAAFLILVCAALWWVTVGIIDRRRAASGWPPSDWDGRR